MKKVVLFFTLIMGFAFTMNAQTVSDTVYSTDTIQFVINNDTTISGAQMCIDGGYAPENAVLSFNVDTIADGMHFAIKVGDSIVNLYENFLTLDSSYIDAEGDSVMVYDTSYTMQSVIMKGYNKIVLNDMFTIDTIECIELYIEWGVDYDSFIVTLTDINIIDNKSDVGIDETEDDLYTIYPNPTTHIVYIQGDYRKVTVYSQSGQKVIETNNTGMVDISQLPKGMYLFRIDNSQPVKVIKM